MTGETTYLSGTSVTQTSAAAELRKDDVFLISEPCLPHPPSPVQYESKSITYKTVLDSLFADLSGAMRFGSMAWESEDDYALSGHAHDRYNRFAVAPALSAGSGNKLIARFTVNGEPSDVYMKVPSAKLLPEPVVGQLRFMAWPDPPAIDPYAAGFDGWVYPDGSSYPLADFPEGAYFENDGVNFTVPDLTDFMRADQRPYEGTGSKAVAAVEYLPRHNHTVSMALSGSVDGSFKYYTSSNGNGPNSHGAKNVTQIYDFPVPLEYSGLKITSTGYIRKCDAQGECTAPSYNSVPVTIYIGGRAS